jgi:hypothetical protein
MNIQPIYTRRKITETFTAEEHFSEIHRQLYAKQYPDPVEFYKKHLFMVSVTFRANTISIYEPTYTHSAERPHPLTEYRKLNFEIMQKMIGNNLGRKRREQPVTHAWVDFDGSRKLDKIEPHNAKNPHVHAVALCHPGQGLKFQLFMYDHFIRRKLRRIASIKISQFDPGVGSLTDMISYCNKGYRKFDVDEQSAVKVGLRAMFPK